MSAGEPLQAEKIADETPDNGTPVIAEVHEDDAWIAACRTGTKPSDAEAEVEPEVEAESLGVDDDLQGVEEPEAMAIPSEDTQELATGDEVSTEAAADDAFSDSNDAEAKVEGPEAELSGLDYAEFYDDATDSVDEPAAEATALQSPDALDDVAEEPQHDDFKPAEYAFANPSDTDDDDSLSSGAMIAAASASAVAIASGTKAVGGSRSVEEKGRAKPEKTGDAMSEFGNSIGAMATEVDEDDALDGFDESVGLYDAPREPSPAETDDSVAPYIAQAERELEKSRSRTSHDIFDRIAMAAESQFDNARGSATRRVEELVDDRRVGTKRWTPSKTMKERMAKLEAARSAAESGETFEARKARRETGRSAEAADAMAPDAADLVDDGPVETTSVGKAAIAGAGAATIAAAAAVGAKIQASTSAPETDLAGGEKEPTIDQHERVKISRRDRQAEAKAHTASDDAESDMHDDEEEDVDGLRIVPGARGRRRDRARRSRLDEDFEKIFDDEDKPSIRGLRRKLRSGAAGQMEGSDTAAASADSATTSIKASASRALMQQPESDAVEEEPKGFFARLFKKNGGEDDPQAGGFVTRLLGRSKGAGTVSGIAEDASDVAIDTVSESSAAITDDDADYAIETETDKAPRGLFSRFRRARKDKTPDLDDNELVAAFEADSTPLNNPLDIAREEYGADEAWEQTLESTQRRSPLASSIVGVGVIGLLVGFVFFAYRYFTAL